MPSVACFQSDLKCTDIYVHVSEWIRRYLMSKYEIVSLQEKPDAVSVIMCGHPAMHRFEQILAAKPARIIVWDSEQLDTKYGMRNSAVMACMVRANPQIDWIYVRVSEDMRPVHGTRTVHGPWCFDVPVQPVGVTDVDCARVGMFGTVTERRSYFIDALADRLHSDFAINTAIDASNVKLDAPRRLTIRDQMLLDHNVIVNVRAHCDADTSIELHRISRCLAMGCVVLAEYSRDKDTVHMLEATGLVIFAPQAMGPRPFADWVTEMLPRAMLLAGKQKNQARFYAQFSGIAIGALDRALQKTNRTRTKRIIRICPKK